MSRRRSKKGSSLPPLLIWLIKAAKQAGEDAAGADISGVPDALREFGHMALRAMPIHGVFVPNEPGIAFEIERIEKTCFGLEEARREYREAVKVVEGFDRRDAIDSAHNGVRSIDGDAHFYAGLAFGITLATLPVRR